MRSPARFKVLLRVRSRLVFLLVAAIAVASAPRSARAQQEAPQCSIDAATLQRGGDPDLHEMTYDVGDGPRVTKVYIEPDVSTFYPPEVPSPSKTKVKPKFNGLSGKFINMSNKPVSLYWYVVVL
jgi:hypothetical protein